MNYILLVLFLISSNLHASKSASQAELKTQKSNLSKITVTQAPKTYDFLNEDWRLSVEQKIRNELENRGGFSSYAKKIRIIVVDDQILLRGKVSNFMEIERILSLVGELEPSYYIYNELTTK
jgi:hypothetical protein